MGSGNFGNNDDSSAYREPQSRGLLGAGWRPLNRDLDWGYLFHLLANDTREISQKTLGVMSDIADAMGRNEYTWWANLLNVFSDNTRYELDEFWNYITPEPPTPDYRYKDVLNTETPL